MVTKIKREAQAPWPSLPEAPTYEEIDAAVEIIRSDTRDFEAAHGFEEDDLHVAVLRGIASGHYANPAVAAAKALRTCETKFPRYCA